MNPVHTPLPRREPFLDWLRIGALAWLIGYHVLAYYARWPWHVSSPLAAVTGPWVEPLMRLSSPWRMSLLFLVSGAVTALLLARQGATAGLLRARAARLLLPLLFGVVLIVPPQSWLEVRDRFGYTEGFGDFLRLYFSAWGGFADGRGRLLLPTWNHLWFLPYLFLYTVLLWACPQALDRVARQAPQALRGWRLAVLPLAVPLLSSAIQAAGHPRTHALVDDPSSHVLYLGAFVAGAVLARAPTLWLRLQAWRRPALAAALATWAATVMLPRSPWLALPVAVQTWAALVAVLGLARRHLDRDHRWRATLAEAVFPVYLVHQTVIIAMAVALRPARLPPLPEALLLVAGTVACGAAFYLAARRLPALRPWVGLSPLQPPAALRQSAL